MSEFEVPQPIICSPFEEPDKHWHLEEGTAPTEPTPGRRPAHYFYREPGHETAEGAPTGISVELKLVNLVRDRVADWRRAGYPGVTATTLELLNYWRRDGRAFRPFFAQLEAVETIIFLNEARRDYLQGIDVPRDEPSEKQQTELEEWATSIDDPRPPVFILVCKNTAIAKVAYEWLGENTPPMGVPPAKIPGFLNTVDRINTIRVDSKVVNETNTVRAKSDDAQWMRFTLDTVGETAWPRDLQGRPIYPEGFEELAKKRELALHPPGRDVRCIVSVGMLTEAGTATRHAHRRAAAVHVAAPVRAGGRARPAPPHLRAGGQRADDAM